MKNVNFLTFLTMVLGVFILISCKKEENDSNQENQNQKIEGKWDAGPIVVDIKGSNGYFTEIKSGNWLNMMNLGHIKLGDRKHRNISFESGNKWNMEDLWGDTSGELRWTTEATLELSENGQELTVSSVSPFTGNPAQPYTMTRIE